MGVIICMSFYIQSDLHFSNKSVLNMCSYSCNLYPLFSGSNSLQNNDKQWQTLFGRCL